MKMTVLIAACVAAMSVVFIFDYRRKRLKQSEKRNSCYLKTETKPQNGFKRVLADNSYAPFKHLKLSADSEATENSSCEHPYKTEIEAFLKSSRVDYSFIDDENVDLKSCDSYDWIETESQLKELAEVLSKERAFGVDTEQHSLRSFLGFTALIQISTVKKDYLVDAIALHEVMSILRPVFANHAVCKVFHGADNDVLWLQRDFHIYVVNLFDTAKACETLSKPQKSLAYLLESYCDVATNKLLQREDWRQRPLSIEMLQYAQMDAHYLLYIARCLAFELIQQGENSDCPDDKFRFVLEASRRSNAICLQLFSKEIEATPGESAALSILSRFFSDQRGLLPQFSDTQDLVRRLCTWRDLMARVHDESLRFVLSDHAIAALVQKLPNLETEIFNTISEAELNVDSPNLISPVQCPSPVICSHLEDLEYIFSDEITSLEDILKLILQEHMGQNGSCPLSLYNYNILAKVNYKLANGLDVKQIGSKKTRRVGKKASRQLFVQKFSCKAPVYHNCRIYANDGRLLCYCDRRKLDWYLSRDLAKLVEENSPAIMLLFEPKGRPEDEGNDFYIQSKKNICVGCGEANHYLRYRIIPSCYRIHFPEHLKSHRSHDIVLVCVDCHEIAHAAAEKHKRQIAAEYGIPLFVRRVVDSKQIQGAPDYSVSLNEAGVSPLQLRTAAMALLCHGPRMPSKRREELTQVVMTYYGGREISKDDLEKALLVGMSPHERRRFQKKKGYVFNKLFGNNNKKEHENNNVEAIPISLSSSNPNNAGDLYASLWGKCSEEDTYHDVAEDVDGSSLSLCMDGDVNTEVLAGYEKQATCDENGYSDTRLISNFDGTISEKHGSKLSLLGHGPHGKQVVDHIMREYGEEGIRQFCQKWRQVFVEAINPHFLPAGWDVMHSGRREFGEFSVYNPAKMASVDHDRITKQGAAVSGRNR